MGEWGSASLRFVNWEIMAQGMKTSADGVETESRPPPPPGLMIPKPPLLCPRHHGSTHPSIVHPALEETEVKAEENYQA
jgi:hypothetical protein